MTSRMAKGSWLPDSGFFIYPSGSQLIWFICNPPSNSYLCKCHRNSCDSHRFSRALAKAQYNFYLSLPYAGYNNEHRGSTCFPVVHVVMTSRKYFTNILDTLSPWTSVIAKICLTTFYTTTMNISPNLPT